MNVPYSPPTASCKDWHGSEMYEITRRMEKMLAAIDDMGGINDESDRVSEQYYCKSCLDRLAVLSARYVLQSVIFSH